MMCPPGVDQTGRSPQQWTIMAPLKQQKIHLTGERNIWTSVLDQFTNADENFGAFDRLINAKPAPFEVCDLLPFPGALQSPRTKSYVEILPPEILDIILKDNALETADLLALSLTSQTLWLQVAAHIRSIRYNSLGYWANTPFVVTGTYMSTLPPALYQHYPIIRNQNAVFAARIMKHVGMSPARRWNYDSRADFTDVAGSVSNKTWMDAFDHHTSASGLAMVLSSKPRLAGMGEALRTVLVKHLLDPIPIPIGSSWTLRNLTAKECVQLHVEDIDASLARTPHVKGLKRLTVDKILVLQSTWHWGYSYWNGRQGKGAHRFDHDAWAGHCFDIVPRVEVSDLGDGWQDVTKEVARIGKQCLGSKPREGRSSRLSVTQEL